VLVVCVLARAGAVAPTYEVTRLVGDHDFLFSFRQAAGPALTPPANNVLSKWQTLPFAWKFFGQAVTGYSISDNGYITFDQTAKVSVAEPVALADPAAPRNGIFAFWHDFKLDVGASQWNNAVWTATLGAAPSRTHVIYWMSATPASTAESALSFLIAIYETGEFEVVYTSARNSSKLSGVAGATNHDGSARVTAPGPGFDFPAVGFGGADDVTYRFKPVDK
jgi:hypothetical protein